MTINILNTLIQNNGGWDNLHSLELIGGSKVIINNKGLSDKYKDKYKITYKTTTINGVEFLVIEDVAGGVVSVGGTAISGVTYVDLSNVIAVKFYK